MAAATLRSNNTSTTDASAYTFAAQASGPTAGVPRIVGVFGRRNASGFALASAVSIGGQALAKKVEIESNPGGDNPKTIVSFWAAKVSLSGNQDVVVNWTNDGTTGGSAATVIRCGFALYDAPDINLTPFHTATATPSNGKTLSANLNVPQGGIALGVDSISVANAHTLGLTGLDTQDVATHVEANSMFGAAHQNNMSAETGRAIQFAWSGSGGSDDHALALISFAPLLRNIVIGTGGANKKVIAATVAVGGVNKAITGIWVGRPAGAQKVFEG